LYIASQWLDSSALARNDVIFTETPIPGAYVLDLELREDKRGFFARTFCAREFEARGLSPVVAQCSISYNHRAGTVRGMHWQAEPAPEPKLVRCTRGAIWDVIIDLRPGSPARGRHFGVELSAENRKALYIPPLCAHGFQTLTDAAEVAYQVGEFHTPGTERGLRHDDPAFRIAWPLPVSVIAEKDASWPSYEG
jgi:dTDP-4-dehydrorhamnose 3,5-epimerase